jgi:hypothetical protein
MKKLVHNRFGKQLATVAILNIACSLLLAPSSAMAEGGSAPACHFGSFTMQSSPRRCLNLAEEVMANKNYTIYEKGGFVRLGGNAAVIVEVACAPTGDGNRTSVTVSAFSSDSTTAERARNDVRAYIANTKDL